MTLIKADLAEESVTIKTRRTLTGFQVDSIFETITVNYVESKYLGEFEGEGFQLISQVEKRYSSDFSAWLNSTAGQEIQKAIEESLALSDPNNKKE